MSRHLGLSGIVAVVAMFAASGQAAETAAPAGVSFKEDVMPVLQIRCQECHKPGGEGFEKTGFDMTSYEAVMKGGHNGKMVVPGDTMGSNLIRFVDGETAMRMPHKRKPLSTCERKTLRDWVGQGAKNN